MLSVRIKNTCAILLVWVCLHEDAQAERYALSQKQMGTKVSITLYAESEEAAEKAFQAAFQRIKELDSILSDYKTDSELNKLCRTSGSKKAVVVSNDLWHVLHESKKLSIKTNGAFDITAGPCIRLWRRARRNHQLPTEKRLQAALASSGYQALLLKPDSRQIELSKTKMRLDLGGIAKGYAADEGLRAMRKLGIESAMVDAGGDIAMGTPPPGRKGWHIALAPFGSKNKKPITLTLSQCGIATSGDAFQHVVINGKRYSHIIDPRTGIALTKPVAVTVVAPNGLQADSLASAMSVLDVAESCKLADSLEGVAVRIILGQGKTAKVFYSTRAKKWAQAKDHP